MRKPHSGASARHDHALVARAGIVATTRVARGNCTVYGGPLRVPLRASPGDCVHATIMPDNIFCISSGLYHLISSAGDATVCTAATPDAITHIYTDLLDYS